MSAPTQAKNNLPCSACVNVKSRISQDNWIYFTCDANKPVIPPGRTWRFCNTVLLSLLVAKVFVLTGRTNATVPAT